MKEIKEKSEASSRESSRKKHLDNSNAPPHTSPSYGSDHSLEAEDENGKIKIRNDNSKAKRKKLKKKKATKGGSKIDYV